MVPLPAAETAEAALWSIWSPAFKAIRPFPPEAVTFAFRVRSSAAVLPEAVSVILPPPVFCTVWLTVSGLPATIWTFPPAAETALVESEPTVVRASAPVFVMLIPAVAVCAARFET